MAYLYFPETRRRTLEEVAAAFNDKVVLVEETDVAVEQDVLEGKATTAQVEQA